MALIAISANLSMLILAAVVYGIGYGAAQPTVLAMSADRAKPGQRGMAMSTVTASFDIGIGSGSIVWGIIVTQVGERGMFLWVAILPVIALLLVACRSRQEVDFRQPASEGVQ